MQHRTRREQDEVFCMRCRKRWAVNEDAPDCLSFVELTRKAEVPHRGPVQRTSLGALGPNDVVI